MSLNIRYSLKRILGGVLKALDFTRFVQAAIVKAFNVNYLMQFPTIQAAITV